MKQITHKCPCGAEITLKDDEGLLRNLPYASETRNYIDAFLASHAACRQAKSEIQSLSAKDLQFCTQCSDLCLPDELTNLGNGRIFCEKCCREQSPKEFINPKPDPDECAEQRSNRATDCYQTRETAKEHAEWLAKDRPGVFHFYGCNVGGFEHWHVEEIERNSIALDFWERAARQQERERILKIIKDTGYQSSSGCCVQFAFKTIEKLLIAIESGAE